MRLAIFTLFAFITLCFYNNVKAQPISFLLQSNLTDFEKADTLLKIAKNHQVRFKLDSAILYYDNGLPLAHKVNDKDQLFAYYIQMSRAFRLKGNIDKALLTIYKASPYLNEKTSLGYRFFYYLNLGHYYVEKNSADSSLHYYYLAESTANNYKPYENWVIYEGIARLFNKTNAKDKVEEYLLKAHAITKAGGNKGDYASVLFALNDLYISTNQADKFGQILQEYEAVKNSIKINLNQDPVHAMLFIDWKTKTKNEKISFLNKVKEANIKSGSPSAVAAANLYLVQAYEEDKQYERAISYLTENEQNYLDPKNLVNHYINLYYKYRIQKKMGSYSEALVTGEKILTVSDKLSNANSKEIVLNLEKKYETQKKENEISLLSTKNLLSQREIDLLSSQKAFDVKAIELLTSQKKIKDIELIKQFAMQEALIKQSELKNELFEKEQFANTLLASENELKKSELQNELSLKEALTRENSLQNNQLKKEQQIKWGLAIGIGLLSLSGIAIFGLYRNQKKKNKVIQKQATDLEVLMKEIHHRVKNNLQVVSSLLDLQSHSITDSQAYEAVKEGKNRVQSMALIHQNLYSEGNIKGIKLKEYVTNLLQTLCDSYNISNDKVKINTNIDDLNLDVDTMIPLGLVLNELVSNAFKYAFKEKQNGELNILLKEQTNQLHLMVSDNGGGFPIGIDVKAGKSFGLKMIRAFAQKLKASLDIYNDNGAVVEMKISKFKTA